MGGQNRSPHYKNVELKDTDMTKWFSSKKDIYTVGIETEGKLFTYFIWSVSHQEAATMAHDKHVALFGPLGSITRCLVWGKCNDRGCSAGQFHGTEFFISTELATGTTIN